MTKILQPQTTFLDYPDNSSQCVILYMVGCNNKCKECHSPLMQSIKDFPDNGEVWIDTTKEMLTETVSKIHDELKFHKTNKLVLSGGDPLYLQNIEFTKNLCKRLNALYEPVDICIYTGHGISYVEKHEIKDFKFIKCGKYKPNHKQESFKNDSEFQLASANQNFFDVNYQQLSDHGVMKL